MLDSFKMVNKKLAFLLKPLMALTSVTVIGLSAIIGINFLIRKVTIFDGADTKTVYTLSNHPETILETAGIEIDNDDSYTCSGLETRNVQITLLRSFNVSIVEESKVTNLQMTGGTVGDALQRAGIDMTSSCISNLSEDDKLSPNMEIAVSNVSFSTVTKDVEIDYQTEISYSDKLEEGKIKTTSGKKGLSRTTYVEKYVGGKLLKSTIIETKTIKEPVNETKVIGTKKAVAAAATVKSNAATSSTASSASKKTGNTYKTSNTNYVSSLVPSKDIQLDKNGIPVSYKKVIKGKASAYCEPGGVTATGKKVKVGYVAVNPKVIPYGTKMFIRCSDGSYVYGYAVAEDTGGFTSWTGSNARVADLYFSTNSECIRFGVRNVEIYILG